MSKLNVARPAAAPVYTHEGARAIRGTPIDQLRRTVLACMLWEDGYYEDGKTISDRIKELVAQCRPDQVAELAIKAREGGRLRHVPLLLARELARDSSRFKVAPLLARVIQRADELAEFLAIYKRDSKALSAQVKLGLGMALRKFDEYQLDKYKSDGKQFSLRDVMFLAHAKPEGGRERYNKEARREERRLGATAKLSDKERLYRRLANKELAQANTWEKRLSAGEDKKTVFTELLTRRENGSIGLGYMALLRNLRGMVDAGVDIDLIRKEILAGAPKSKALPFRFIAAARAVPQLERALDTAMVVSMTSMERLEGETIVLVDVSGSMEDKLSGKSDLTRMDAGAALSVLLRGVCDDVRVFTFSDSLCEVPARHGMALVDAIVKSQKHGGTYMGLAVSDVMRIVPNAKRLIVFTDEQSADVVKSPKDGMKGYIVNVATSKHGVGDGPWVRINGFSEAVVQYIAELERLDAEVQS